MASKLFQLIETLFLNSVYLYPAEGSNAVSPQTD